ncbi:MAG TPA: enoyl-CoA hydratase/isomerase family protein [Alphaproteobacteria bacterium]|jgi:enoyl-CoA hydratase/carnithine racemase|nr:enoyl-CoA hydratase/isomerase family protein [Alphaproteobacteria bacterium]
MPVVTYEKRDRIAYVTLNRPEAKNAINQDVHRLLCAAWEDFGRDDSVDVAILTGTGDAFCAGMDLKQFVPDYVGCGPQKIMDWAKLGLGGLPRGYHRLEKPVIAAVNGWALAGGFELAMAADIRIASERARFGSFEARRGFHHADGGIARLVNFCGVAVALEMLLTAEPIDAERARQINLVARVVPHDKLLVEAELTARHILRNDQAAVRSAKRTVLDMIGRGLDDQLYRECLAGYTLMADNPPVKALLQSFYDKTDHGRHGVNATPL